MKRMDLPAVGIQFVPIVMAFDSGFLLPSAVTMISVMENGTAKIGYHFLF